MKSSFIAALVIAAFTASTIASVRAQETAHAQHGPRHGGLFFPAHGDTLHIEGLWPQQRRFKLFVSDEAGRALPIARLRQISGRIVIGDQSAAVILSEADGYFEARIPSVKIPAAMELQLSMGPAETAERFSLTFPTYSNEADPATFELAPTMIPDTVPGILDALREDIQSAKDTLSGNEPIFIYAPAVRARDRMLALEARVGSLPPDRRNRARTLLDLGIRASWLLHTAGDEGSPEQLRAALRMFEDAIGEVIRVFEASR